MLDARGTRKSIVALRTMYEGMRAVDAKVENARASLDSHNGTKGGAQMKAFLPKGKPERLSITVVAHSLRHIKCTSDNVTCVEPVE